MDPTPASPSSHHLSPLDSPRKLKSTRRPPHLTASPSKPSSTSTPFSQPTSPEPFSYSSGPSTPKQSQQPQRHRDMPLREEPSSPSTSSDTGSKRRPIAGLPNNGPSSKVAGAPGTPSRSAAVAAAITATGSAMRIAAASALNRTTPPSPSPSPSPKPSSPLASPTSEGFRVPPTDDSFLPPVNIGTYNHHALVGALGPVGRRSTSPSPTPSSILNEPLAFHHSPSPSSSSRPTSFVRGSSGVASGKAASGSGPAAGSAGGGGGSGVGGLNGASTPRSRDTRSGPGSRPVSTISSASSAATPSSRSNLSRPHSRANSTANNGYTHTSATNHNVTAASSGNNSTNDLACGLSIRHGISSDRLRLLSNSPPETKYTNLACTGQDDTTGKPVICDVETGQEVYRHPDLWFDDGSVVCRAENMLFCVHMSQLARHSLCFRDMFMMPQGVSPVGGGQQEAPLDASIVVDQSLSTSGSSSIGGYGSNSRRVPVIYLYDKAEDVANLLTALYDGPSFRSNDEEDFRVVAGILRLSTKYLIDSLRAKALAHLSTAWPMDLKSWDSREDLARIHETENLGRGGHRYPHPYEIINLAREVDAPMLLPAAFYDLARYPFGQIFEPNEDDPLYRSPPPAGINHQDIQRLCLGKEAAQHSVTSLIQSMGNGQHIRVTPHSNHHLHHLNHGPHGLPPHHSTHLRRGSSGGVCVSAAACRKDFSELVDLATQHYLFDRERGCCDPLYVAEELGQLKSAEFSECKACARSLESWAARERERIWKMVPYWFRLEYGGGEMSPNASASGSGSGGSGSTAGAGG